jgi:hypothetical protein
VPVGVGPDATASRRYDTGLLAGPAPERRSRNRIIDQPVLGLDVPEENRTNTGEGRATVKGSAADRKEDAAARVPADHLRGRYPALDSPGRYGHRQHGILIFALKASRAPGLKENKRFLLHCHQSDENGAFSLQGPTPTAGAPELTSTRRVKWVTNLKGVTTCWPAIPCC